MQIVDFCCVLTCSAANTSVIKAEADHMDVTPSPATHPRTSLRGDNTPVANDVSNGHTESKSKGKAPAKGGVGKSKGKQKGRAAGERDDVKEEDGQATQVERRAARVVAEDSLKYTADTMKCPLPGCDSKGTSVGIILAFSLLYVDTRKDTLCVQTCFYIFTHDHGSCGLGF